MGAKATMKTVRANVKRLILTIAEIVQKFPFRQMPSVVLNILIVLQNVRLGLASPVITNPEIRVYMMNRNRHRHLPRRRLLLRRRQHLPDRLRK